MNNNEQLQAAKDQAAMEIYQTGFKTAIIDIIGDYYNGIVELTTRAMEIYAEMVLKSRKKKSKINPYEPTRFKAINSKTTNP